MDGACLAIKSYVGHALYLAQQGVSLLFAPQVISISHKEYTCPSLLGLPDLLRQYVPPSTEIFAPVLDARKGERALALCYRRLGKTFAPGSIVRQAWNQAHKAQLAWEQSLWLPNDNSQEIKVLLLGPRYLTDDPFLSGNIIHRLEGLGMRVYTAAQVRGGRMSPQSRTAEKRLFWSNARQSVGALEHFVDQVNGVVSLAPFGCGAESFVVALVERRARNQGLPSLTVNLDEHTSTLGMMTRLEAFCDLLERKESG